jgi:hypothetical protein
MERHRIKENQMYKKISHTIVEEHFDHPMDGQVKAMVSRFDQSSLMPSAEELKQWLNGYFTNFSTAAINYVKSVKNSSANLLELETALFANIDQLGQWLKPYYGFEVGEKINTAVRNIAVDLLKLNFLVENNLDTADHRRRLSSNANTLANVLYSINNSWNFETAQKPITDWLEHIYSLSQLAAKKDQSQEAIDKKTQDILNLATAIASVMANGVINQHPDMFVYSQ